MGRSQSCKLSMINHLKGGPPTQYVIPSLRELTIKNTDKRDCRTTQVDPKSRARKIVEQTNVCTVRAVRCAHAFLDPVSPSAHGDTPQRRHPARGCMSSLTACGAASAAPELPLIHQLRAANHTSRSMRSIDCSLHNQCTCPSCKSCTSSAQPRPAMALGRHHSVEEGL